MFLVAAYASDTETAYAIVYIAGNYYTSLVLNNNKAENGITLTFGNYGYIGGTSTSGNDITFVFRGII